MVELENMLDRLSDRTPNVMGHENFSKFAVLLPLIKKNGDIHVLFEVRSLQLRRQPGEICFPGGRMDQTDDNAQHTAIRETCEELGVQEKSVTNVAPLDYLISPFGTIIYPYIGMIQHIESMQPNPAEVEEIFTVPLAYFQSTKPEIHKLQFKVEPEESFPFHAIVGGRSYNWQARGIDEYFYYYEDRVIWGLTAKILTHFLDLLCRK